MAQSNDAIYDFDFIVVKPLNLKLFDFLYHFNKEIIPLNHPNHQMMDTTLT